MTDFKLIKQLGLEVIIAMTRINIGDCPETKELYAVDAEDLERVLEKGVRVYDQWSGSCQIWGRAQFDHSKNSAIIIGIEPIKKETAEDVLQKFVDTLDPESRKSGCNLHSLIELAKRVLDAK